MFVFSMEKITRDEKRKIVDEFFKNIQGKTPSEIKKVKNLAMRHNIPLGEKRKLFCKKCFVSFSPKNHKLRIKKGKKTIVCEKCGYVARLKIKN